MDNFDKKNIGYFIAGLVAGEGCFSISKTNQFSFSIEFHPRDKDILIIMRDILKCGGVYLYKQRKSIVLRIGSMIDLKEKVIPFFDEFLITTYKKTQYENWKKKLNKKYEEKMKNE